jgi:hypothetical protein
VFAGRNVGIKKVSDKIWLVSLMQHDLGFFGKDTKSVLGVRGSMMFLQCKSGFA